MHMLGNPRTMQADPTYDNVVTEIGAFFEERLATLNAAGVDKEAIVSLIRASASEKLSKTQS